MSKIRVDLMRHSQSEFNIGIHKLDPDITEEGKKQAAAVTGTWDIVVCSTLARSEQTLRYSGIKYTHFISTPLCREIRGGSICDYKQGEEQVIETRSDLDRRKEQLEALIRSLHSSHPKILVISHACFMVYLTGSQTGFYNCQLVTHEFNAFDSTL